MQFDLVFKRTILLKTLMLVLIIIWGAYVQSSVVKIAADTAATDIGGVLFLLFSIFYFVASYFLYSFKYVGKLMFVPAVGFFIILGFLTELLNPSQFPKDIFYLFTFYIISPIFFICQGIVISLIYFTELNTKFYH